MEIKHKQNGIKGSFFIQQEGNTDAEMTYSMTGKSLMIIDHTKVNCKLRGEIWGINLFRQALSFEGKTS